MDDILDSIDSSHALGERSEWDIPRFAFDACLAMYGWREDADPDSTEVVDSIGAHIIRLPLGTNRDSVATMVQDCSAIHEGAHGGW
jgi:hypothetical protein